MRAYLVYSERMVDTSSFSNTTDAYDSSHICAALDSSISELKLFFQDTMNSSVANLSSFLSKEYDCIITHLPESQGVNINSHTGGLASKQCSTDKRDAEFNTSFKAARVDRLFEHSDFSDCDMMEADSSRGIFLGNQHSVALDDETEQSYPFSGDDFLGHASESEKRTTLSSREDLWDSDANQDICNEARLVTMENCLPTSNLNTQIKLYRKRH
ncbi:unnamed protein product [Cuscuta epithymum]|uniref:Uncharacterized protein n=1 Tax=Cuscuta epithymum TaxID=186058 RepID=A0AAV0ENE0_9ASTE|nr:unnamed protein product [Cuscuta epithymum]